MPTTIRALWSSGRDGRGKRVDVDDKAMNIKVVYNTEKISIDEIRNTIAASGYDADDVKAPAEAYAKLDGCCKGEE